MFVTLLTTTAARDFQGSSASGSWATAKRSVLIAEMANPGTNFGRLIPPAEASENQLCPSVRQPCDSGNQGRCVKIWNVAFRATNLGGKSDIR